MINVFCFSCTLHQIKSILPYFILAYLHTPILDVNRIHNIISSDFPAYYVIDSLHHEEYFCLWS